MRRALLNKKILIVSYLQKYFLYLPSSKSLRASTGKTWTVGAAGYRILPPRLASKDEPFRSAVKPEQRLCPRSNIRSDCKYNKK